MKICSFVFTVAVLMSVCLLVGCQQGGGLSGLSPIKGKITLDGVALEKASIILTPTFTGENARNAGATSDKNGEFHIQTLNANDGAFPGDYVISVTKMVPDKTYTEEEIKAANEKGESLKINATNAIPQKYAVHQTSGLKCTVVAGKNPDLVLELSSK